MFGAFLSNWKCSKTPNYEFPPARGKRERPTRVTNKVTVYNSTPANNNDNKKAKKQEERERGVLVHMTKIKE